LSKKRKGDDVSQSGKGKGAILGDMKMRRAFEHEKPNFRTRETFGPTRLDIARDADPTKPTGFKALHLDTSNRTFSTTVIQNGIADEDCASAIKRIADR
jgi:hypothetical protein